MKFKLFFFLFYSTVTLFKASGDEQASLNLVGSNKPGFTIEKYLRYHNKCSNIDDVLKNAFILRKKTISIDGIDYKFCYRVAGENLCFINQIGEKVPVQVLAGVKRSLKPKISKRCAKHKIPLVQKFVLDTGTRAYSLLQTKIYIFMNWFIRGIAPNRKIKYVDLRSTKIIIHVIRYCPECRNIAMTLKPWVDSDGDMICDTAEKMMSNDPNIKDFNRDTDKDGYTNLQECRAGTDVFNPFDHPSPASHFKFSKYWIQTNLDSDEDGFSDYDELYASSGILNTKSHPPLACFLKLKRIWRTQLPVRLLNFEKNKDGTLKITLATEKNGVWRAFKAKIGDNIVISKERYVILSGKYLIKEFFDRKLGRPIASNRSTVTIKNISTGNVVRMCVGEKTYNPKAFVGFTCDVLPEVTFSAREDDWINIGSRTIGFEKYKLGCFSRRLRSITITNRQNLEYTVRKTNFK